MSFIKIKCECEFNGEEYKGVVVTDGVEMTVGDACDPQMGKVVTFNVPSPILMVSAIKSFSISDGLPEHWLVLTQGV